MSVGCLLVSAEDKILFNIVVIFLLLFSPCRWRGWVSDVILFSIIWTSREGAAWNLRTFKVPPHSKNLSGQDDDKPVDELNSREQTETKYQSKVQQSLTSATWIPDRGQRALPFERNIRPMSTRRILNPWFENVFIRHLCLPSIFRHWSFCKEYLQNKSWH